MPAYIQSFLLEALHRLLACAVGTAKGRHGVPTALAGRYIQRVIDSIESVNQSIRLVEQNNPIDTGQTRLEPLTNLISQTISHSSPGQPSYGLQESTELVPQLNDMEAQYW